MSDELFIDEETKNALLESELKGFDILPVYNTKKSQQLENTYQVFIKSSLECSMEEQSYDKKIVCEECGNEHFKMDETLVQLVYKKKNLEKIHVDIIKTKEHLGMGAYEKSILVSHKMYMFLIEHNIVKNLVFNVVVLED